MKVWVVQHQWDYENDQVMTVVDSESKAIAICNEENMIESQKRGGAKYDYWHYTEMEIT